MGNLLTTVAGFALASRGNIDGVLCLVTLIGLGAVIASACVFNNCIDREIDAKMARTKNRALVTGRISIQSARIFAGALLVLGLGTLGWFTNLLATGVALTGFLVYVVLYSLGKCRTIYGTAIGSIAGAMPPVVGYCAVSDRLDVGAFILFAIMVLWQMPHFYAIAMFRLSDYKAASIPLLPIVKGAYVTKMHMLLYIIFFVAATGLLTLFGYEGFLYLVVSVSLGLAWLWLCIRGFQGQDDNQWARQMFVFSLVLIVILCFMIAWDYQTGSEGVLQVLG